MRSHPSSPQNDRNGIEQTLDEPTSSPIGAQPASQAAARHTQAPHSQASLGLSFCTGLGFSGFSSPKRMFAQVIQGGKSSATPNRLLV